MVVELLLLGFGDDRPERKFIHGLGDDRPVASHGFGEERPSAGVFGVFVTDVGAVDALVDEEGVNGDLWKKGDCSINRADLGGTSGGGGDLSAEGELFTWTLWGELPFLVGMTSGVRDFGESGCRSESEVERVLEPDRTSCSVSLYVVGPSIHVVRLSPCVFCRHLVPGALVDLSCTGGRPGIVAKRQISTVLYSLILNTYENPLGFLALWS
jgi:hypothetical protein